jgi:hypothetical protein
MANSSNFAKGAQRQGEELWNVSLLPLSFGTVSAAVRARELENVDERRSPESFPRPLRASQGSLSGSLS